MSATVRKIRDADPLARGHLIALLFDLHQAASAATTGGFLLTA
jgi:hypothetical protein